MTKLATIDDIRQVLAVYLGEEVFGIPIAQIQGVLETLPLTYVPLAPAAVRGVMNLRGRIVTAIDLRTSLNAGLNAGPNTGPGADFAPGVTRAGPKAGPKAGMSVVVEHDGDLYSLLVDRVGDVLAVPAAKIEEPPLTMNPAWKKVSSGVFQLPDGIMVILKPAALLILEAA